MTYPAAMTLAFVALCALLCALPFVPALQEWRRPTDAAPLPVLPDYTSDIDHFAHLLQADAAAALACGPSAGDQAFDTVDGPADAKVWEGARRRLLAAQGIATDAGIRCTQPLYVQGAICAGPASSFTAVFAAGDLQLGPGSEIMDWAHADGVLSAGPGSGVQGRGSAGTAIRLGSGCRFERLQAPEVVFGEPVSARAWVGERRRGSFAALGDARRQTDALYLVRGDCSLPAGHAFSGSLIVTGVLSVGAGTTIEGDVKARRGVTLGPCAAIDGAVTCESRVHLLPAASVRGPLVTEGDMLLEAGARVGAAALPTTVSARNIVADEGVVVHGAVWAHGLGMVRPR